MPLIALIDGLLPIGWPGLRHRVPFREMHPREAESPAACHAGQMALAIGRNAPTARLDSYAVFSGRLACSVTAVCRALDHAAENDADIVHCSFGLARNEPDLACAVARVLRAGKTLVASAPARGAAVFPASYDGVIAVQGDARCTPELWSWLDLPHAAFGACALGADGVTNGASTAAAHFCGHLARTMETNTVDQLRTSAAFKGRERILDGQVAAGPEN